MEVLELKRKAEQCRKNVLRMVRAGGHGHIGGALSAIDIVTALYFDGMNIDPQDRLNPDRDRFLLSAGHKCLSQYAVLAERGFFDKSVLDTYGEFGSRIPGHPDMHKLPGIEANTGALGHGMSIAAGMALSGKLDNRQYRVFAITGDGELPEGSNWEAAAAAAKFGLDNLTVFVDYNGLQISGRAEEVMNMQPLRGKFEDFGWSVLEIDGNAMDQIQETIRSLPLQKGRPTAVIAKTVKGKGISFAEDQAGFHFWNATDEQLMAAEAEIDERIAKLTKALEEGRK